MYQRNVQIVCVRCGGFHYNPFIKIVVVLISKMDNSNIITARPHKRPRHTHYVEFLPGRHYRCSDTLPGNLLNVNGVPAEEYGFWVETTTQHRNVKGKTIPLPLKVPEVGAPIFQDNRHLNMLRLSDLRSDRFYPPGNIPGTHFC
jgi:hypothetical protein